MALSFTQSPLDHAGMKRTDPEWIEDQRYEKSAQAVLFSGGNLALNDQGDPMIVPARRTSMLPILPPGLIFLGLQDGAPWFAGSLAEEFGHQGPDFRISAMNAPHDLAAIMGRARSLLQWHGRRRFCSNCGTENEMRDGGSRLKCPGCGMEHYPRVNPSVIMLTYSGDRAVLGRQPSWPQGMYATLAGFMEPGETIEEACAREVMEEVHRPVIKTRYIASQPWPFPDSLMIGLLAEIEPGEVIPDDDLEDARWFERHEVSALMDEYMAKFAPENFSISRLLIQKFLDGETV